jgi:hypothetical protein
MPSYKLKADSSAVERRLDDIWSKLRVDKGLIGDLAAAGYSPADIPAGKRSDLIVVKPKQQGLFEVGNDVVVALVAVAPAAKRVLTDIWAKILLPRLVNYLGPSPKPRSKPEKKGVSSGPTGKKAGTGKKAKRRKKK